MSQPISLPSLNHVVFCGRLVADPHPLKAAGDREGSAMTIAINRKQGRGKPVITTYVDVVVFGDTATACNKFLARGSAVMVSGALSSYDKKRDKGPAQKVLQVSASAVEFLSPKPESTASEAPTS